MAKTTTVYFKKICDYDKNSIIFRTVSPKETTILVKSVEDGIVTVEPMDYCTIPLIHSSFFTFQSSSWFSNG